MPDLDSDTSTGLGLNTCVHVLGQVQWTYCINCAMSMLRICSKWTSLPLLEPAHSLLSLQSPVLRLYSPDGTVASGNNLHQGRHIGVAIWEVHIKHKAAPAVRSVLGTRDNGTDKVQVVLVLGINTHTAHNTEESLSYTIRTCIYKLTCIMHTCTRSHTHKHSHTLTYVLMHTGTSTTNSTHLSDENGGVKMDLQQVLKFSQLCEDGLHLGRAGADHTSYQHTTVQHTHSRLRADSHSIPTAHPQQTQSRLRAAHPQHMHSTLTADSEQTHTAHPQHMHSTLTADSHSTLTAHPQHTHSRLRADSHSTPTAHAQHTHSTPTAHPQHTHSTLTAARMFHAGSLWCWVRIQSLCSVRVCLLRRGRH